MGKFVGNTERVQTLLLLSTQVHAGGSLPFERSALPRPTLCFKALKLWILVILTVVIRSRDYLVCLGLLMGNVSGRCRFQS